MTMRLYSYWRSSAAYRVRIALNLKGLDYEIVPISLAAGKAEHRGAEYRAMNPQMLVPFFEDGDVAIGQSMAILEYLEEAYPAVSLLPKSEPLRSRVRAFANIIACDIHPLQNLRVQQHVTSELEGDGGEWARRWISTGFDALEALLGDGLYAFGDSPTLADALLVPQMFNARRFETLLDAYPKLVAVVDHCEQLDAFKLAAPTMQIDASAR